MAEPPDSIQPSRRKRQFTIRSMLFGTMLVAIAAAGFSGLVRADEDDLPTAFVLFVVAAPLALLLVLSLARTVERLLLAWRKRRETDL
jgi:magnesium-transporting ATPase (P-type)